MNPRRWVAPLLGLALMSGAVGGLGTVFLRQQAALAAEKLHAVESELRVVERRLTETRARLSEETSPLRLRLRSGELDPPLHAPAPGDVVILDSFPVPAAPSPADNVAWLERGGAR